MSILGDSISTFAGYSNDAKNANSTIGNNAVYYTGSNYLNDVSQTWWKRSIDECGMKLLVNNSYSGDMVTKKAQERAINLHDDTIPSYETDPDIIAVYMGINDFDNQVSLAYFKESYLGMVQKMMKRYHDAEIYLFTLVPNNQRKDEAALFQYNSVIKEIAEAYSLSIVDIYEDSNINQDNCSQYMGDSSLHPNIEGMQRISDCFLDVLYEKAKLVLK